jgi:hypothetical protein
MGSLSNRGAVAALAAAAGVWAVGWGVNFVALRDYSSPRGHGIVLVATVAASALVALGGVRRALGDRMSPRSALLTALAVGLVVAAVEFGTWIVLALLAVRRSV